MAAQNAQSSARHAGAARTFRLLLKIFAMTVTLFSFALLLVFIMLQYKHSEVAKQTTFNIPFRYVLAGTPMLKRYSLRTFWYEGYLQLSYNTIWDSVSSFPPDALHISFERFSVSLEDLHLNPGERLIQGNRIDWHGFYVLNFSPPDMVTEAEGGSVREIGAPIWAFALVSSILPLMWLTRGVTRAARVRRRRSAGLCVGCGYDIRATPNQCTECGRKA